VCDECAACSGSGFAGVEREPSDADIERAARAAFEMHYGGGNWNLRSERERGEWKRVAVAVAAALKGGE
jgi:hypothetical protein